MRSHSGVLGGHEFGGNAIQPSGQGDIQKAHGGVSLTGLQGEESVGKETSFYLLRFEQKN